VLALADAASGAVHLLDASEAGAPELAVARVHAAPVAALAYAPGAGLVVSADGRGVLEVWSAEGAGGAGGSGGGGGGGGGADGGADDAFAPPPGTLAYAFKSDTDMYAVAKARALPTALAVSPDGAAFAVCATDGRTRLFRTRTGALLAEYDDSPAAIIAAAMPGSDGGGARDEAAGAGGAAGGAEPLVPLTADEAAGRAAVEREMADATVAAWRAVTAAAAAAAAAADASPAAAGAPPAAAPAAPAAAAPGAAAAPAAPPASVPPAGGVLFDESGEWLLFSCALGVKVAHVPSRAVVGVLGGVEAGERFTALALAAGAGARVSSQTLLAKDAAAFSAPMSAAGGAPGGGGGAPAGDPTLLAAAAGKPRFYSFTRREPPEEGGPGGGASRDVMNEPLTALAAGAALAAAAVARRARTAEAAVLHTAAGDVHLRLFPDAAPRAVENFVALARAGRYDGTVFHRVIKGFMVQGGEAGPSAFGAPFPDELAPHLRFDRPGVLAMANAGPVTNESQFFITTAAAGWLNGKHTIFGAVTKGMEAVRAVEGARVGKDDKPVEDQRILGVLVK